MYVVLICTTIPLLKHLVSQVALSFDAVHMSENLAIPVVLLQHEDLSPRIIRFTDANGKVHTQRGPASAFSNKAE